MALAVVVMARRGWRKRPATQPAGREGEGDEEGERDGGAGEELMRADPVPRAGDRA